MKNIYTTTIAIAFSVLAAGQVMAAGAGDTIEPITGMTMREINPAYYGGATAQSVKTRAEVRAELMKAQSARNAGDTVEPITGMTMREINPARYGKSAN